MQWHSLAIENSIMYLDFYLLNFDNCSSPLRTRFKVRNFSSSTYAYNLGFHQSPTKRVWCTFPSSLPTDIKYGHSTFLLPTNPPTWFYHEDARRKVFRVGKVSYRCDCWQIYFLATFLYVLM